VEPVGCWGLWVIILQAAEQTTNFFSEDKVSVSLAGLLQRTFPVTRSKLGSSLCGRGTGAHGLEHHWSAAMPSRGHLALAGPWESLTAPAASTYDVPAPIRRCWTARIPGHRAPARGPFCSRSAAEPQAGLPAAAPQAQPRELLVSHS